MCPKMSFLRFWNRFEGTGTVAERPLSGRLRSTTARQDHYMVTMAGWQRFQSFARLNTNFQTATRMRVTPQTVRNRFHTANLHAFRLATRAKVTSRHTTARLQWARNHANWQLRHWTPVILTIESCFCVNRAFV
jgi:hypothetical protein